MDNEFQAQLHQSKPENEHLSENKWQLQGDLSSQKMQLEIEKDFQNPHKLYEMKILCWN